jgi:drug/metabolite transporter (DMT)-like permease
MRRIHADLLLFAAAAIWGVAFLFQKSAMDHIGPFTFISARGIIAALALAPFAVREVHRHGPIDGRGVLALASFAGAGFFIGAAFQQFGLITASVTNTGFLTALYVVVTPFISWAATARLPNHYVWPAVALSFAGTWYLGGGTLISFSSGDLLVAISAIFWASHAVTLGFAARHRLPILFTTLQFAVVAVFGTVGAILFETVTLNALVAAAPSIAYVGLLSSALTFTIFTFAMHYTTPSEATVIVSTETLFAALAAYLLLGERLPPIAWLGAALILAAILIVQMAPGREKKSEPVPTVKEKPLPPTS